MDSWLLCLFLLRIPNHDFYLRTEERLKRVFGLLQWQSVPPGVQRETKRKQRQFWGVTKSHENGEGRSPKGN